MPQVLRPGAKHLVPQRLRRVLEDFRDGAAFDGIAEQPQDASQRPDHAMAAATASTLTAATLNSAILA